MDDTQTRMAALFHEIAAARAELRELQRSTALGAVEDYVLEGPDGPVRLSELFGDGDDLIVVQNMGRSCPYCTMWADGFIGLLPHIEARAALAVASPDAPADQAAFAAERGWPFRMVSTAGTAFKEDLGFASDGQQMPGVTVFHRDGDGRIRHTGSDFFGPDDAYNGAWHFFALLEGGTDGFAPRFHYR